MSKALAIRRRNYKKRPKSGYRGGTETLYYNGPSFCPERMFIKLRWADYYDTNLSNGERFLTWRGNSIFDPDGDVGPFQKSALGANVWSTFYKYYRVHSSSIKLSHTMAAPQISSTFAQMVALYPSTSQSSPANCPDIENAMAKPESRWLMLGAPGGGEVEVISHWASTKRIFGVKRIDTGLNYAGVLNSTDPPDVWWWNCRASNGINANSDGFKLNVEIEYTVELFARQDTLFMH